jgi:hypothetical protein
MQKHAYDPLEELVLMAQSPGMGFDQKKEIAEVLLPYAWPKLASVALEGKLDVGRGDEAQSALLQKILSDPLLADAAQRLSVAAAQATLESEMGDATGLPVM